MDFAQRLYAAAAKVTGMLTEIVVTPAGGGQPITARVGFFEPSEVVLAGEVMASSPYIKFATADLPGLKTGALVAIGARTFKVGPIERLGDGSECRATLTK